MNLHKTAIYHRHNTGIYERVCVIEINEFTKSVINDNVDYVLSGLRNFQDGDGIRVISGGMDLNIAVPLYKMEEGRWRTISIDEFEETYNE